MGFVDDLRAARSSRAAVLHEFWMQYDPKQKRLHVFFEGHEDAVFFRRFVDLYIPVGTRVFAYRCDGKSKVFDAFTQITTREPGVQRTLFFVDKDLDDVLGTAWPTDPRIYVTDVYSIENYLVTREVLSAYFRDAVRLVDVVFDEHAVFAHFETQLARFHRSMTGLMAWIVAVRRSGERPNLNNLDLDDLCELTDGCELKTRRGRLEQLCRKSGVSKRPIFRRLYQAGKELVRLAPKRIVRGKFEAWFLVEFWKKLALQLHVLTREGGGRVTIRPMLERGNAVAILTPYVAVPRSLQLFLEAHFPGDGSGSLHEPPRRMAPDGLWKRLLRRLGA